MKESSVIHDEYKGIGRRKTRLQLETVRRRVQF